MYVIENLMREERAKKNLLHYKLKISNSTCTFFLQKQNGFGLRI